MQSDANNGPRVGQTLTPARPRSQVVRRRRACRTAGRPRTTVSKLLCSSTICARSETMTERLSDIAIQRELGSLPGWSRRGDAITKTYQFRNFLSGIDFVSAVAKAAEAADHHPDIDIRYTKIVCTLSTHSAGGITQKDLDLARKIETVQEQ